MAEQTTIAQERLEGASDPSNDRDLKGEARKIIDEVFDDEGDRQLFEGQINEIIDRVTANQAADYIVALAIDGIINAYHRTAPAQQ